MGLASGHLSWRVGQVTTEKKNSLGQGNLLKGIDDKTETGI